MDTRLLWIIGGFLMVSFIASLASAWEVVKTRTGFTFKEWLKLTTWGSMETRDGWVYFTCPKHGLQRDIRHGYAMGGWHTLVFTDTDEFVDCPQCRKEEPVKIGEV